MSTLPTKSFAAIVGTISAGMQGRINNRYLNFAIGTILRGVAESYAGVALSLQYLILQVAKLARLGTSFGADVDSWMADWPMSGITRFGPQAASGLVTFARITASAAVLYVPVGGLVKSSDGSLTFQIYADTSNPSFVPSYVPPGTSATTPLGGYVIPAQVNSVVAPVVCITPSLNVLPYQTPWSGANGNAAAGTVSLLASPMSGVDTVTNAATFTNGFDTELDAQLKVRWQLNVAARGGGTVAAYTAAIANLKQGMTSIVRPGFNLDGSSNPGTVTVIIDDGTGATPAAVVAAAQVAVSDTVLGINAAGITAGAYAATTIFATAVGTVVTLPGYLHSTVVAQVAAASSLFINSTGQGVTLKYSRLNAIVQSVAGVDEVLSLTINGVAGDLAGSPTTTIKAANPTFS